MRKKEYSWYLLSNAPGFGPKSIHYILERLKENNLTINNLFDLSADEKQKLFPEIGRARLSWANFSCFPALESDDKLYADFEKMKSEGVALIGLDDERYPASLLQNMGDSAPPILYCKGYLPLLNQKGVSIVGAREVGEKETSITKNIATKLAEQGMNVTSGYAKGVDTSAHLGALEAQGTTTMILSFGINQVFIKKEMSHLNWEKNALFVTQFAPNEKFSGSNAMMRNKLVVALSKAIVVIKSGPEENGAGKRSGTFDAGKSALKMGIPVFVLRPNVLQPAPQGNEDLINLGGLPFENAEELLSLLSKHEQPAANEQPMPIPSKMKNKNTVYQSRLFD